MTENPANDSLLIKLSKIISNFFNPIVSLFIYYLVVGSVQHFPSKQITDALPLLFIVGIPTIVWIFWNVKKGNYTNMDVSNRQQRNSLYVVIVVLCAIYLAYEYFVNKNLDVRILFLEILLILMQISNFFLKSSMHTALNLYVAFLFLKYDLVWGISWIILSIIVGITRIILKRHTLAEVISGVALGSLIGLIYYFVI
ncbi:phosphatase PAP2 family protein [Soonwooa sp.]|uniref:phosphatase PAP2 family protein n=1 Tax=Soonwooa sp. TaxID=1938592 RepID=UPI00262DDD8B|nr:phosphatase PAP2 family protein [Soonwooa sp.]